MIISKAQLEEILKSVYNNRNPFLSEAQLQFDLAIALEKHFESHSPNRYKIYLEYPTVNTTTNARVYYDIVIKDVETKEYCPIELKYKTKKATVIFDGTAIDLKNHAAQDLGRFDYLKDVERIENFNAFTSKVKEAGYAIILTNDHSYWSAGRAGCIYDDFALNNGRKIDKGMKSWAVGTKVTSVGKSRINGLTLKDSYYIEWKNLDNNFKFLMLEIK